MKPLRAAHPGPRDTAFLCYLPKLGVGKHFSIIDKCILLFIIELVIGVMDIRMKTISSIKWTDRSIEHIARHGIRPEEVVEACFNEEEVPFIRSGRENLHYVFGKTYSGRFLFVVTRSIRLGEVRIITARDMNQWENAYSDAMWPLIPIQSGHPFRSKMATCSDPWWPPLIR